ncbi:MAG: glycosyltransferase family 4 protein [Chlamydiae bacterium]|nr:glycosyltransferase family 4 protein [Chlamydiota bacterium]MBI3276166.1 glycosyltransferase family 4 protein [Chlamydiota bacterium]
MKIKVLLVASHLDAGGITSYLLTLAKALKEKGVDPFIASGGGQFERSTDLAHFNIGIHTKSELSLHVLKGAWRMKKIIQEEGIQLIHAQTRVAAVTSFIASHLCGIPFLTTAHGFYRPHRGRKIFPCWGDAVIAISSHVRDHLEKDFKVSHEKIHLIYNGTDLSKLNHLPLEEEKMEFRRQYHLDKDIPTIGIIARLSPVKGHRFLLEALHALSKVRKLQCLVVGDGPSRKEFLDDLTRFNLKNIVRWIPWTDHSWEVLSLLDVFVLPSLQEGLSLSILEAQAAGVPVVASNVGGISEVVVDGKTGILVPPQDSQALERTLNKMLEDPALARHMGSQGREHVSQKFNLDRMTDKVIALYEKVLSHSK